MISRPWFLVCTLLATLGTSLAVMAAAYFAKPYQVELEEQTIARLARFDGLHYLEIAEQGYFYDPQRQSTVAFFPLYPLLIRGVGNTFGLQTIPAALIVSNVCFLCAASLFARYAQSHADATTKTAFVALAVAVFLVWPTGFFFRMAYTESLFCLLALAACVGMRERARPVPIALVIACAIATRFVGIALLPAFLYYLWKLEDRKWRMPLRLAALLLLASSGILLYSAYLGVEFGDPLCFAKAQSNWTLRTPLQGGAKLIAFATMEPIWSVYVPSSPAYWGRFTPPDTPLTNLQFANPIFFLIAVVLTAIGYRQRWLEGQEVIYTALVLLIPYVTRAHEMCMASQGRFALMAFAVPLVAGRLLAKLPLPVALLIVGSMLVLLIAFAAEFGAGGFLI